MSMPTVTIPKEFAKRNDLIAIPRKEYEGYLEYKEIAFPVERPTKAEIRALARAEEEIKAGKVYNWEDVKNELANLSYRHRKKRA